MKKYLRPLGSTAFIVSLLVILFSYAMFQGGFVSWFLFFAFLPILLYELLLIAYPVRRWQVMRSMSLPTVHASGETIVTLTIKRRIPFPLFYLAIDEVFPPTLDLIDDGNKKFKYLSEPQKVYRKREFKQAIFPHFKREINVSYKLTNVPRGKHVLQSLRVKTGDLFGLVKKEHEFSAPTTLVVYPNERPLYLLGRSEHEGQGLALAPIVHTKPSTVVSSVRDYVAGDKLAWIDWKQTAKRDAVMTKEFDEEKSEETLVVLDRTYYEGINELAFEATIEVFSSLVRELVKRSPKLELRIIGRKVDTFRLEARSSDRAQVRNYLTEATIEKGPLFSVQLKKELVKLGSPFSLLIVTTRISEELVEVVQQIKRRHNQVQMIYLRSENAEVENEKWMIERLKLVGIATHLLTEKELVTDRLEVNGS